jgi:hypothetical protein
MSGRAVYKCVVQDASTLQAADVAPHDQACGDVSAVHAPCMQCSIAAMRAVLSVLRCARGVAGMLFCECCAWYPVLCMLIWCAVHVEADMV